MKISKYVFWRLMAIAASIYILGCFVLSYFTISNPADKKIYLYALIPVTLFMIYSVIHQMRFPLDLRIYIIWVIFFSYLSVAYGDTALSIMILYCAYLLGVQIKFFTPQKKYKYFIIIPLYFVAALCQIRLPKDLLLRSLQEFLVSIAAVITMFIINSFIMKKVRSDILMETPKENIEDFFAQENFTDRDKEMLKEVLAGCKYEEIAMNHKLSLSSVKKRLAYLYKKVGVTCQIDFIIKFTGKTDDSTKV